MSKTRIAIVLGTTRAARFADKPAAWLLEQANARTDIEAEIVDLRDFNLPFFDEVASEAFVPSTAPEAIKWQEKVAEFDAFIFMVAEYNHGLPASLKNALDNAYSQWVRKPMTAFGYGGLGAAVSVEALRTVAINLQMAPVRSSIHLGGGEFYKVHPLGADGPMEDAAAILTPAVNGAFDDLVWWSNALKPAREQVALAAE